MGTEKKRNRVQEKGIAPKIKIKQKKKVTRRNVRVAMRVPAAMVPEEKESSKAKKRQSAPAGEMTILAALLEVVPKLVEGEMLLDQDHAEKIEVGRAKRKKNANAKRKS